MDERSRLKQELTDDPLERGYSGMTDAVAAVDLNAVNRQVNIATVSRQDVFEAIAIADFTELNAEQKSLLYAIIGMGDVRVNGTNTKAALLSMFGPGTVTRANLAALQKENVSRAAELGLLKVREGEVASARRTKVQPNRRLTDVE